MKQNKAKIIRYLRITNKKIYFIRKIKRKRLLNIKFILRNLERKKKII